ncbi:MAG: c-type cytochrome [Dehalococcoidales bacterium]|nr:c-type cytochrome [Dehalococcoidales bacterium]
MAETQMSVRMKYTAYSGLILLGTVIVALFASLVTSVATRAAVEDERGGLIFEEQCTECHTIGGGILLGPDLEGVTSRREKDWLISFIISPKKMIAAGDPIALQLVREAGKGTEIMPDHPGLSVQQIEWILAYIEVQGTPVPVPGAPVVNQPVPDAPVANQPVPGAPVANQPVPGAPVVNQPVPGAPVVNQPVPGAPVVNQPVPEPDKTIPKVETKGALPAVVATAGDANKGRDIFTGKTILENGGAACISCHNVDGIATLGGGSFASDLTNVLGGKGLNEKGLTSVLSKTPFPIMKAVFGPRPLGADEVVNLVSFLKEISAARETAARNSPLPFIVCGIIGLLLIVIIQQVIWRGRLSGVRQSLVKGGSK